MKNIFLTLIIALNLNHSVLANTDVDNQAYLLQPGDVLNISVWNEPELQSDVLIRPDGNFTFPLIGEVLAKDKNIGQITDEITNRLKGLIPEASVTVSAMGLSGNKIYVIGNVNRPGEFAVSAYVDVMQALSIAGGTTKFADLSDILILRRNKEQQEAISFNYSQVKRGNKLEQNIVLRSGDVVVVP